MLRKLSVFKRKLTVKQNGLGHVTCWSRWFVGVKSQLCFINLELEKRCQNNQSNC